jgi:predicted DNA-binding transcriptional regulator AlpA
MNNDGLPPTESRQVFFSLNDLSAHFGIPLETMRGWRKRGLLPPALKVGKHVRWRRESIEAWIKLNTEGGPVRRQGGLQWRHQVLQGVGKL